jgi:hypothetical protein
VAPKLSLLIIRFSNNLDHAVSAANINRSTGLPGSGIVYPVVLNIQQLLLGDCTYRNSFANWLVLMKLMKEPPLVTEVHTLFARPVLSVYTQFSTKNHARLSDAGATNRHNHPYADQQICLTPLRRPFYSTDRITRCNFSLPTGSRSPNQIG